MQAVAGLSHVCVCVCFSTATVKRQAGNARGLKHATQYAKNIQPFKYINF
jgi:hypothetical protein